MDKMKFETVSLTERNIDRIAELFPNVVTEVKDADGTVRRAVDFDALKAELSDGAVEGRECYEFTWAGKTDAKIEAAKPIRKTLRPCKEESKNWDTTQNLYIEGDNLDVLKLLQESYLNKVKMIYIDPPYNTGNDFVYADDFRMNQDEYEDLLDLTDENDNRMIRNTDSNGRFHSDWCSMMYSRLKLARNLLTDDGVIFISIDDNEQANLKKICDEIFGVTNCIANICWAGGRKNDSKFISVSHEYIIIFAKNINNLIANQIVWREKKPGLDSIYKKYDELKKAFGQDIKTIEEHLKKWFHDLPDNDPARLNSHYSSVDEKGIFFADNISWPGGGGPKYEIRHPITNRPVKIPSRGWLTNEQTMREWIKAGIVNFGKDENSVPTLKAYLKDRELSVPYSVIYKDGRAASKRLAELFGDKVFENPKDENVIKRLIDFTSIKGDIVLDFFSGSATTAHSVFLSNLSSKASKKFILVQIPEIIDPQNTRTEKSKKVAQNAIDLLDSLNKPHNICEIGKERIRRAGEKIKQEYGEKAEYLDIGFRVLKLDSSNMKDVYYTPAELTQDLLATTESNFKEDRTDLDLLYGCLLDWGLELSLPHETKQMDGFTVHYVNHTDLVACFDKNVSEKLIRAIAADKPLRVVFRDSCFKNISDKNNVKEIFKALSPDTTVKVI